MANRTRVGSPSSAPVAPAAPHRAEQDSQQPSCAPFEMDGRIPHVKGGIIPDPPPKTKPGPDNPGPPPPASPGRFDRAQIVVRPSPTPSRGAPSHLDVHATRSKATLLPGVNPPIQNSRRPAPTPGVSRAADLAQPFFEERGGAGSPPRHTSENLQRIGMRELEESHRSGHLPGPERPERWS